MSALLDAFDRQMGWCRQPSPFSARVLARSLSWLKANPDALAVLSAVDADPLTAAVPLRWLAGLHHLALQGLQPWADLWPPAASVAADEALDAAITLAIAAAWRTPQPALRRALAGHAATADALLAWLRFEPPAPDKTVEVRCRFWPGGEDRLLARCHPHAARIEWLAGSTA